MRIISDLHVHSRFAMACSSNITVAGMEGTAKEKGINLVGTGDFTHPTWLAELKGALEPAESGLLKVKGSNSGVRFMLTSEVSTVFMDGTGSKRIHQCILVE